jgi:hypothetical protein
VANHLATAHLGVGDDVVNQLATTRPRLVDRLGDHRGDAFRLRDSPPRRFAP